jgi:DNA-binding FrmR family transcriptional regulator
MRSDAELYEFIKRLRRSKTQLSKVKKSIESEE